MTRAIKPGWYPDPQGPGQRYWDGQAWGPRAAQPFVASFPPTAQTFPHPLTSASGQVSKVKGFWAGLPTVGRLAVAAAPVVVVLIAIIVACVSSGDSATFNGTRGDRDAHAYWEDTGRLMHYPETFARGVCRVRANGASEDQAIEMNGMGLHGERQRDVTSQDVRNVVAAEYHFCPEYY
jgi:Protein of unknown function (DUF2510)